MKITHGGDLSAVARHFPDSPQPWLDLSTGICPWPYPAPADDLMTTLHRLPQLQAQVSATQAAASYYQCREEDLIPTPGSEIVFALLPDLVGGRTVGMATVTYGDYHRAWRGTDASILTSDTPLELAHEVDVLILCNPNNPDGRRYSKACLLDAYELLRQRGGTLLVDEAYADVQPADSLAHLPARPGLIVTRSFGKFFGLPGLRLGWTIAAADFRERLAKLLGFWSVSSIAFAIAERAYLDTEWQCKTRSRLMHTQTDLMRGFEHLKFSPVGATNLFTTIDHPRVNALWHHCALAGIYLRRFDEFPNLLRFGVPSSALEADRLFACLASFTA